MKRVINFVHRFNFAFLSWLYPLFWITYTVILIIVTLFLIFGVPDVADWIRANLDTISKLIN